MDKNETTDEWSMEDAKAFAVLTIEYHREFYGIMGTIGNTWLDVAKTHAEDLLAVIKRLEETK